LVGGNDEEEDDEEVLRVEEELGSSAEPVGVEADADERGVSELLAVG
jgi:hypothetical protein